MNPSNTELYKPSGKHLTEKPKDLEQLFFYDESVAKVKEEIEDGEYKICDPWTSSDMGIVHYTELEYPIPATQIDYLIDDINSAISLAGEIIPGSHAIILLGQALKIIMDEQSTQ